MRERSRNSNNKTVICMEQSKRNGTSYGRKTHSTVNLVKEKKMKSKSKAQQWAMYQEFSFNLTHLKKVCIFSLSKHLRAMYSMI